MKRVVTGHNQEGKSVFVSIGEPPRVVTSEHGNQVTYCWGTQRTPAVPGRGDDPTSTMSSLIPSPGGTSFSIIQFPGNSESRMHATDSVDYAMVVAGEIWLVLDDGAEALLTLGDCLVQDGARHAWHNRKPEPCVMVAVVVGAERQECPAEPEGGIA